MHSQKYLWILLAAAIFMALSIPPVQADRVSFLGKRKAEVGNVLDAKLANEIIRYRSIAKGYVDWDSEHVGPEAKLVTIIPATPLERRGIIGDWKKSTLSAVVERNVGPPLTLVALGIRSPLPEDVNYLMGSPKIREGVEIYLGKNQSEATNVSLGEMRSITFPKGATKVHILWKNSKSETAPLLGAWRYGNHLGAPAVVFGMNADTFEFVEVSLKSIKRIQLLGNEAVRCTGREPHSFETAPETWKFCPFDGAPLSR